MYSALKKDGVRLYELARQGIEVEREYRDCEIFSLEVDKVSENEFSLVTECSAGTYIRSLISDIGDALNTGAVMTSLNRTVACGINEDMCVTLSELEELRDNNALSEIIIPVDKILEEYPSVFVSKAQSVRFKNGGELSKNRIRTSIPDGLVRVYCEDEFLGLGESFENNENLMVKRVYVHR
jgi:tRNA pseudouridine55 synthase